MAKIIKVGSQNPTFTQSANPYQTSRQSTTNPFKFTNFEGNTLQFADVFEGFKQNPTSKNKLKMISSSVAGTMNKMKSSIAEPIINFVNRVRGGISNAWDYAKNTNISDLGAVKAFNNVMNTPINIKMDALKGISDSMSTLGKGISSKMDFLNQDVTDIGKGLSEKWTNLISKIHTNKVSAETPVAELEQLWKDQIALDSVEAA